MKRLVATMMLVLTMMLGAGMVVAAAVADNESVNFKNAGLVEFATRQKILSEKAAAVVTYAEGMPTDGVISRDEILTMRALIAKYGDSLEKANEELAMYGLKFVPDPRVLALDAAVINVYHKSRFQDSSKEDIRRFFVGRSGKNVVVESGYALFVTFVVLLSLAVVMFVVFALSMKSEFLIIALILGLLALLLFGCVPGPAYFPQVPSVG